MVKIVIMDLVSAKTEKTEKTNISIHPKRRSPEARLRRKMNQTRNRLARAQINQEYRGEAGSRRAGEYHSKLKALSMGLYGT